MTDEQITAMVARLRSNRPLPTLPHEAADMIEAQAAEIARLREALGFYANLPCRLEFGVVNECPYDDGDTARAALAQETQP